MDEKRHLLKQLGWPEALIDAFLLPDPQPEHVTYKSVRETVRSADSADLCISMKTPISVGDVPLRPKAVVRRTR